MDPNQLAPFNRAALVGAVVDSLKNLPLPWVEVRAKNLTDSTFTYVSTDSAGGFFLRALVPGPYLVTARRVGYVQFISRKILIAGVIDTLRVRLAVDDTWLESVSPSIGGFREDPSATMVLGVVTSSPVWSRKRNSP